MKQDIEKCMECKFWLYFENEKKERCSIKGCWCNSKFVPYTVEEDNEAYRDLEKDW